MATSSKCSHDFDAIVATMEKHIEGSKQGKSEVMRPTFHPDASFFGLIGEQLAVGIPFLFDWIDKNGAGPDIEPRCVTVDLLDSVTGARMSDLFTLRNRAQRTRFGPARWASSPPARAVPAARPVRF